jgi:hypothetical protein
MGWGDEIMVTGQARRLQEADPRPVIVRDRNGRPRWHPIFEGNPRLRRRYDQAAGRRAVQFLDNYSGHRPYLNYARFNNADKREPYVYTAWRASPGEIYLTERERTLGALAAGALILEPTIKPNASPNKDWGRARWQALAEQLTRDGARLVQIGPVGTPLLEGVAWIQTNDVRQAAAVLSGADLLIAPEGGLHHAAAALGVRAVVIFGGFISPATTGYDAHTNLYAGGAACGMRLPCAHCAEAMAAITPRQVADAAFGQLCRPRALAA